MATRTLYDELSTPPVAGDDYLAQTADHLKVLLDKMHLPVTSPAGTNTYTGTIDPSFDASGYVAGMMFSITWPVTNTSATVTLNLNAQGAVSVKEFDGSAPAIGALVATESAMVWHTGTEFRMVAPTAAWIEANVAVTAVPPTMQKFTASGTWNRPSGCKFVKVTVTGPGGGGGDAGADPGNAGATTIAWLDVTAIASSTITIGTGGVGTAASKSAGSSNSIWADGVNTLTGLAADTGEAHITATGGDINLTGGFTSSVKETSSYWGPGTPNSAVPVNAINPGSGAASDTGTGTGANGADGIIVAEEFY